MLREILLEGAAAHGFENVYSEVNTDFLRRKSGGTERYLVLKVLEELLPVDAVHEQVLTSVPDTLTREPAFNKNCDLVLIHRVAHLADYKGIEKIILSYEEDPYHFKKYFLYFISAEEELAKGKSYSDFASVIPNKLAFSDYKKDPLRPSFYSLAARIFIKLPFLEVPRSTKELVPLSVEVDNAVSESGLGDIYHKISSSLSESDNIDALVQELISEELENIEAADPGV